MKPIIVTLTGQSCAGKTTLENMLAERGVLKAISHTTRPQRVGEVNGKDYYFMTQEAFNLAKSNEFFIETVEYSGASYGMSAFEIRRLSASGKPIVIVCEPNGRNQIANYCKNNEWVHVPVFVGNSQTVIVSRTLSRFLDDVLNSGKKVAIDRCADRIASIIETEQAWVAEAMLPDGENPYLIGISSFDGDKDANETADFIVKLIQSARKSDVRSLKFA